MVAKCLSSSYAVLLYIDLVPIKLHKLKIKKCEWGNESIKQIWAFSFKVAFDSYPERNRR